MENNQPHIHSFKQYVIPPTCKEKGYTLHKCDCGYSHKDNFTPIGTHNYKITSEKRPTCTEHGEQTLCCKFCGETIQKVTDPLGHVWGDGIITKSPTCTEDGEKTYHCDFCDEIKTEPLSKLGHAWGEWTVKEFATCTEDGKKIRYCSRCNLEQTESIPAKGHDFSSKKNSETEKGVIEYFCKNCGETIKKETKGAKLARFFNAHKKVIVSLIVIVIAISILAPIVKFLILPIPCYNKAQECIKSGDYAKAYDYLLLCENYKDSKELLNDFQIHYKKEEYSSHNWYGKLLSKTIYEYDENGNTLFETRYFVNSNTSSQKTYINEYDKDNNLISRTSCTDDGENILEYTAEYDEDGNRIRQTYYVNDGEISSDYTYEYDEKGNLIRQSYKNDDSYNSSTYSLDYQYDSKGRLIEVVSKDDDENITYKAIYKKGIIKKETHYYSDGTKSYEYKYDKKGRITTIINYPLTINDETILVYNKTKYERNKYGFITSAKYYNEFGICESKSKHKYYDRFIVYNPTN